MLRASFTRDGPYRNPTVIDLRDALGVKESWARVANDILDMPIPEYREPPATSGEIDAQ